MTLARVAACEPLGPYLQVRIERSFAAGEPGQFHMLQGARARRLPGAAAVGRGVRRRRRHVPLPAARPGARGARRRWVREVEVLGPFGQGFDVPQPGRRPCSWAAASAPRCSRRSRGYCPRRRCSRRSATRRGSCRRARAGAEREIGSRPPTCSSCWRRGSPAHQRVRGGARRPRARGRGGCAARGRRVPGRARGADGLRLRRLLRLRGRLGAPRAALRRGPGRGRRAPGGGMSADLATRVGAVELEHPVMNASGTLDPLAARDAGLEIDRELALLVTKTVTPLAREGNEAPRVCRGRGRDAQLDRPAQSGPRPVRGEMLPAVRALGRPLVVSIGGFEHADYELPAGGSTARPASRRSSSTSPARTSRAAASRSAATRRDGGGRACLPCGDAAAAVGQALAQRRRSGCDRPRRRARRRRRAGAHEHAARRSRSTTGRSSRCSAAITGGLSGPALKPVALAAVHTCREACALPHRRRRRHRERLGCARVPGCGRKRRAGRERGVPRAAARPADPRGTCHPTR